MLTGHQSSVMTASLLCTVVLLLVTAVSEGVRSSGCPDNVMLAAAKCLPSHFSNGLISNLAVIQLHCQIGMFERSLDCLTNIEASCKDDQDKLELLHSYMDMDKWRDSWTDLCTNIQMLQQQYPCWMTTSQQSSLCIKHSFAEFSQRLKAATRARVTSSSSSSALSSSPSPPQAVALANLQLYCNTSEEILRCFQPIMQNLCPPEMSRLLESIYLAFQPPLCERSRENHEQTVEPTHEATHEEAAKPSKDKKKKCPTTRVGKSVTSGGSGPVKFSHLVTHFFLLVSIICKVNLSR